MNFTKILEQIVISADEADRKGDINAADTTDVLLARVAQVSPVNSKSPEVANLQMQINKIWQIIRPLMNNQGSGASPLPTAPQFDQTGAQLVNTDAANVAIHAHNPANTEVNII